MLFILYFENIIGIIIQKILNIYIYLYIFSSIYIYSPHFIDKLQKLLEISRRYKITNPEKMRSEYGKLVYLMQDADTLEIKQLLG